MNSALQKEVGPITEVQQRYLPKNFPGSSHSWAAEIFNQLKPVESALDIGPGSGVSGRMLSELGTNQLFGVEIDEQTRLNLRGLYTQVEDRLEAFSDRKFSLILCLDVLEHMPDPFTFLGQAVELLEPGGHILISLPNIAHWSVRIPLLFGQFQYQNRGLLDRTHLQFFTRKRALELVASVPQLEIKALNSSIEPLELLLPEWCWNNPIYTRVSKMRIGIARLLPGLMAYQHLILAQRRKAHL